MPQEIHDLHYCFFVVDERPLCLWDDNIKQRNLRFLNSIDPSYFKYLYQLYANAINRAKESTDKDAQHPALAMRTAYSQALETLFALLFSAIQAHWCIPAWINAYTNSELRNLVEKVQTKQPVISVLDAESPAWSDIFDFIFPNLGIEDKQHEAAIRENFARTWSRFAVDFLDKAFVREFNSIKHGLRVRSGGFKFRVGIPDEPGVPPPPEKMIELTSSDFGSGYFNSEKIGTLSHHVRLRGELRNWELDSIAWGLQMAAISIKNVQSSLCAINSGGSQIAFIAPSPLDFDGWRGFTTMTEPEKTILPEYIQLFSKEQILSNYNSKSYFGIRRLVFTDEEDVSL